MESIPSNSEQRDARPGIPFLSILESADSHIFAKPIKRIHEGHDLPRFFISQGYSDIGKFIMQLNHSMCPRKVLGTNQATTWSLDSSLDLSEPVRRLQELLQSADAIIKEAPPDTGPRRFGNISFRKWFEILESRLKGLLETHLPKEVLELSKTAPEGLSALDELSAYFLGAFGNPQRLDYGTGHELSFLAFIGCLWKLGAFAKAPSQEQVVERSIVLGVIEPYFRVIRNLILTYTLEPAGSHGVWGLDDHFFLPYILGSSQYCPAISNEEPMPLEGSLPGSRSPADITKKSVVEAERQRNMYFSAIGFINDVKTGPFWEHSPILFDISGIRTGWGKVNKGMIKMYNAEVLSKFPVVQHFPFGSLFSWEEDKNAIPVVDSVHIANQPQIGNAPPRQASAQGGTKAPWATPAPTLGVGIGRYTQSSLPSRSGPPNTGGMPPTRSPGTNSPSTMPPPSGGDGPTKAPWAR